MRLTASAFGILALSMMIGGCASANRHTNAQTPSSPHVAIADGNAVLERLNDELHPRPDGNLVAENLNTELWRSTSGSGNEVLDSLNDELSRAIGTTSLTSEVMLAPMPLPESRMSLSEDAVPATVTWGTPADPLDLAEIPDTRE